MEDSGTGAGDREKSEPVLSKLHQPPDFLILLSNVANQASDSISHHRKIKKGHYLKPTELLNKSWDGIYIERQNTYTYKKYYPFKLNNTFNISV